MHVGQRSGVLKKTSARVTFKEYVIRLLTKRFYLNPKMSHVSL